MSARHGTLVLFLLLSLLVTGCGAPEPAARSMPATATRIAPGPTNTPRPAAMTPVPPAPMNTPGPPTETPTASPAVTSTPTRTSLPSPTATATEAPGLVFYLEPGLRVDVRTYGGQYHDRAFDVLVTEDGGSLIVGLKNNLGLSHRITPGNAWLIKTDAQGAVLWEKEYGGEKDASFSSIIQAGKEEYVLLGEIAASYERDETDVYLVKVDGDGNEIWSHTFGGRGMDLGKAVRQTADGGYIVIGDQADEHPTGMVYESKLFLSKRDAEGKLVWSRTYGDEILYLGWGVAQAPDGGYVLTGWEAKTIDDRDVLLIKTDEAGEVEWSRTWDLGPGERDGGFDLILTSDGYIVIACIQSMGSGAPSAVLIKVDLEGNEIWNKLIGEEGVGNTFWHIIEDSDGGYLLAGDTHLGKVPRTGQDLHGAWMVKTDTDGEILWQHVFGQGEYEQAHFFSAAPRPAGGYIFVGQVTGNGKTYSDIMWMAVPPAPPDSYVPPAYVKADAFREQEITVGSGEWALPGTLSLPAGKGPFAAVVLVHGSGPNDRDETMGPNKPFRDLAWGLASRGIAVLRYEKRSRQYASRFTSTVVDRLTSKEETTDDALAAVALLRQTEGIDPARIYVLGHSLGGYLLPRIGAADPQIAGLIVMAGPVRPLEDLMLEQFTYIFGLDGVSAEEQAQLDDLAAKVARVKDPNLTTATATHTLPLGTPASFWLDLRGYNPAEAARELDQPMLILQGGRDYQVTTVDLEIWKSALTSRSDVQLKLYPGLNHLFMAGEGKSTPAEYEDEGHVAEEVVLDIATWILD